MYVQFLVDNRSENNVYLTTLSVRHIIYSRKLGRCPWHSSSCSNTWRCITTSFQISNQQLILSVNLNIGDLEFPYLSLLKLLLLVNRHQHVGQICSLTTHGTQTLHSLVHKCRRFAGSSCLKLYGNPTPRYFVERCRRFCLNVRSALTISSLVDKYDVSESTWLRLIV